MNVRDSWAALSFAGTSYCRNTGSTSIPALGAAITMSIWVKIPSYSGTQFIMGIENSGVTATTNFEIRSGVLRVEKGAGSLLVGITKQPAIGVWTNVTYTSDGSTNTVYVDGVLDTTSATAAGTGATTAVYVSTYNGASEPFTGLVDEARIFNRALTGAEVLALYNTGNAPTGQVLAWLMNEGAGTSVTDSSGTGNTGTISAATFTADVPFKPRKLVNGNLVTNGDFSYVPPFTAATTTNGRWIDGTAAGSTTNTLFGWQISSNGASQSAQVTAGSAIATIVTGGASNYVTFSNNSSLNGGGTVNADTLAPVLPSTNYTITVRYRSVGATVAVGSVQLRVHQFTASPYTAATEVSSSRQTVLITDFTGAWATGTLTFTSTTTTTHFNIGVIQGNSFGGANGNAGQSLEFSLISCVPTTPTARLAA